MKVYLSALRALWLACVRCQGKFHREPLGKGVSASRRNALLKLGGACACCGLGIEYARVLDLHHVKPQRRSAPPCAAGLLFRAGDVDPRDPGATPRPVRLRGALRGLSPDASRVGDLSASKGGED